MENGKEHVQVGIAFMGMGRVGRSFVRLLASKQAEIEETHGLSFVTVGVATANHGIAVDPEGLNMAECSRLLRNDESLQPLHKGAAITDSHEFIRRCREEGTDVMVELTLLNPESGQPATDHVREALSLGMHAVTANKGPAAFAYEELSRLAQEKGVYFRLEGAIMDGAPIISLVERTIPVTQVLGFRGVLNSTTNFILSGMEEGLPPDDALRQAKALGITEEDYEYDLKGWDAAVKAALLVNVLMKGKINPVQVTRTGIEHITTRTVIEASRQGRRFKLIAEAELRDQEIFVRVVPRMLPLNDPLAQVSGASTALTLITDTLGELTITLREPTISQTAYAILSDLILVATS